LHVYSLTLHVDNLPEIEKRQSENKAGVRASRRDGVRSGAAKKEKLVSIFRSTKCGAHSDAAQHRKMNRLGWIGRRAGGSRGAPRNSRDLPRGGIIELPALFVAAKS